MRASAEYHGDAPITVATASGSGAIPEGTFA
jgi:hypothetical protein